MLEDLGSVREFLAEMRLPVVASTRRVRRVEYGVELRVRNRSHRVHRRLAERLDRLDGLLGGDAFAEKARPDRNELRRRIGPGDERRDEHQVVGGFGRQVAKEP